MTINNAMLPECRHQISFEDRSETPDSIDQLRRVTAVLAHELRNPLSVLQAGLDLMDDSEDGEHSLKKIFQRQVEQMTRLIEDLLDSSRSADGKVRVQRRPIDLMPCLEDAIKNVEQTVSGKKQCIKLVATDESLWLDGDPHRIVQIVANLLSNASKYSGEGTDVVLTVACIDEEALEIRVRDRGIGIDAKHLESVFDFFSQVRTCDSLAHSDGGLGIGLGLVRTLVQMHAGFAWATSDGIGKGSEFIARLPRCEPQPPGEDHDPPDEPPTPARILIVDDQRSNVYMLNALLKKLGGHELRSACDGASALSELTDFVPDIVLLDLGLPDMSGVELATEIRRLQHCGETLLVALTGYDDDQLRTDAAKAGIDLYRLKPVSLALLQEIFKHRRRTSSTS